MTGMCAAAAAFMASASAVAEWGTTMIASAWWAIIPPGAMVTIIILASTMVGTSLEDALNPRLKIAHLSLTRWRIRTLAARGPEAI